MTLRQAQYWEERQQGFLPGTSAPVNTAAPVISGDAIVGRDLTCTNGSWTVAPDTYSFQWYRGVGAISLATNTTYRLTGADAATDVSCKVIAIKGGVSSSPASSNVLTVSAAPSGIGGMIIGTSFVINGDAQIRTSADGDYRNTASGQTRQTAAG